MFNALKKWWKLRLTRRAQQKALDAQYDAFAALHQPIIERFPFSPVSGRPLYWKILAHGVEPFDTQTGLPARLKFSVHVDEADEGGASPVGCYRPYPPSKYFYDYDPKDRKLRYRIYYEPHRWTDIPESGS